MDGRKISVLVAFPRQWTSPVLSKADYKYYQYNASHHSRARLHENDRFYAKIRAQLSSSHPLFLDDIRTKTGK